MGTAKGSKLAAIACTVLAIAAVVVALLASQKRVAIQGPSALAPLPGGSVWLGVDRELWRLDAQGRRELRRPVADLGLPGPAATLGLHPDGRMVATVRGDSRLHFLDPASGRRVASLAPQWPADLARHGGRAINVAFHPDGRVAIATGGGHAVAAFDAQGRFLGRSRPGAYEFTNGLWWQGERLWTTDTNRGSLVALDGRTLQESRRVVLHGLASRCRFVALAEPWAGGAPGREDAPLATLVRYANGMVEGDLVDALPGGRVHGYQAPAFMEPRDIKRRGDELWLVDGASYSIRRFSAQRQALGEFGDASVRGEMRSALQLRHSLQRAYWSAVAAAVVLFLAGLLLAWRAQWLERGARLAAQGATLAGLGTPLLDLRTRLRLVGGAAWPLVAGAVVAFVPLRLPRGYAFAGLGRTEVLLAAMAVSLLLVAWGGLRLRRRFANAAADPQLDALLNQAAVLALRRGEAFWTLRLPGEVPRETLMLQAGMAGRQWLVLTDRRLLVFASNLTDFTLRREIALAEVAAARVLDRAAMTRPQRWRQAWAQGVLLEVTLRDGSAVQGWTPAMLAARRVAGLLQSPAPAAAVGRARPVSGLAPGEVERPAALWQTLASLAVPGSGQWMQRRTGTALLMFSLWAFIAVFSVLPIVWTLWAPRAAVSPRAVLWAAVAYALVCGLAALDTWRTRATPVSRT